MSAQSSEEMRLRAESLKQFAAQWSEEELNQLCECGDLRINHALGKICLKLEGRNFREQ